jgi:hypothetical protein
MIIELYTDVPYKALVKCEDCEQTRYVARVNYITSKNEHPCRSCSNKRNGKAKAGKYTAWNSGKRYSIRETERTEYVNSAGYIEVWCGRGEKSRGRKDGYKLKHHLVMEDLIGRKLEPGEIVHHINGQKTDNRAENLYLCTGSEHRQIHASLERVAMQLVQSGKIIFKNGEYFAE